MAGKHKFRAGDLVRGNYRSAHFVGHVTGVAKPGSSEATTTYSVRPSFRHTSSSGSKEAAIIHRTGTHLHRVNAATYKRDKARQQAKAKGS